MEARNPPRLCGPLLALLGAALAVAAIGLLRAGDSVCFLAIGLGAAAAGARLGVNLWNGSLGGFPGHARFNMRALCVQAAAAG